MLKNFKRHKSFWLHDWVKPKIGSIVYCKLDLIDAEHTGIYIGNNQIVELNGDGCIDIVSSNEFTNSTLFRTGLFIYVACDENDNVLGNQIIAQRAKNMIGKTREYNLVMDNCHQFTCGCISDDFENANNFFWMVEFEIEQKLNSNNSVH